MPHWLTEGLAVWSEGHPRPQEWNELLARRAAQGKLFNLQTLNFAFTRPQSSDEWQLGYCQAELYVEFMLEGRTFDAIRELSAAYAAGAATPEAILKTFAVRLEEFERGYAKHVKKVVASLSSPEPPTPEEFHRQVALQRERPNDAKLAAEVAYEHLRRGAGAEAEELARQALRLQPKQPLAIYVLARLHVRANRSKEAMELLEPALDRGAPDLRILNLLAGLKLKEEKYAEAAELYRLGGQKEPHNLQWTRSLARVYVQSQEDRRLPEVLVPLAAADPDDLATRKKLTALALTARDYRRAAEWANQALQIDVQDAEPHRALAEALAELRQWPGAIEEYETAIELQPQAPQPRFALADVYVQSGKPREARRVLEELRRRHPNYPGADLMLENLKESEKRDR
jgi:Flp pilus assembly protein TadD